MNKRQVSILVVALAVTGLVMRKTGVNEIRFSRQELQQVITDISTFVIDISMHPDPVTDDMVVTYEEHD